MNFAWSEPLVVVPLALLGLLALARQARLRPGVRPLVAPYALAAAVASIMAASGWRTRWAVLLLLVPALALIVRGTVLAFQWAFERRRGAAPPALLDSVLSVAFYGLGAAFVANRWFGVELTPFLATSAVVGAVVGLALQDTLGNLFAGIALHTEAPFRVGDWLQVGDRDGRVEQVSWRAMRLRTWDGDTLTLPNNDIARKALLNYSLPRGPHSRALVLGLGYHTPPNRVLTLLQQATEQVEGVPAEPRPVVRIIAYDEYAMRYEIRYFFANYEDYRRVEGEIYRLVWYRLRRAGIDIPVPVRQVVLSRAPRATVDDDSPRNRLQRVLRTVDLFDALSDEELQSVAERFRPLHYAQGERIIEEGQPGDSFFVIDRGEVQVSKRIGGSSRLLARLTEGQFFGEMALLTGEDRTATVVAATDVDVFTIDKEGFKAILARNPAVAVDISTLLSERREALSQAEGDVTSRYVPGTEERRALRERILDRIRSYFGI